MLQWNKYIAYRSHQRNITKKIKCRNHQVCPCTGFHKASPWTPLTPLIKVKERWSSLECYKDELDLRHTSIITLLNFWLSSMLSWISIKFFLNDRLQQKWILVTEGGVFAFNNNQLQKSNSFPIKFG